jgi:PKD repeat protein
MKNINKNNKMLLTAFSLSAFAALSALSTQAVANSTTKIGSFDTEATTNIVGGNQTTPYSRPYQVALLMNGRQGCGGTLIGAQWVLTAAHCLDNASTSSLTVRVGAHSIRANDGETIRVSQIITHQNWRGASGIQSGYDIGVLRLATPASSSITPAALPTQAIGDQIAAVGQYVTVSGWGLTYNQGSPSDTLREVALPVISNSSCSSELGANVGNGVICGGGPNGTSACNGDSGGPFAVQSNGKFYSIGTVSWGRACSGATAFTRTTAYLAWIEQQTGIKPDGVIPPDELPVARFTSSVTGNSVYFNNNSTDDGGIVGSSWLFGDGGSSTSASPSHNYVNSGNYTVTLTVTDTSGQTNSTSATVTIGTDECPSAMAVGSFPTWSASSSYALGDNVSFQGKNYEAIWWSTGASPAVFSNVWKVIGDDDGTGTDCPDENTAPVASFSTSVNELTVTFSNASTDDKAVVSYSWNFGDSTTSTSKNPSHDYAADGSYTVTLTVSDVEGLTNSTSKNVTVESGSVDNGCDGIDAWSATTSYGLGDEVAYNGTKYTSIWWSTTARPDVFSNVWTANGACSQ